MDLLAQEWLVAGPFPQFHQFLKNEQNGEIELISAVMIDGVPVTIAQMAFAEDDDEVAEVRASLASGEEVELGVVAEFNEVWIADRPAVILSAYVGLKCADGRWLMMIRIKSRDQSQDCEDFRLEVMTQLHTGLMPIEIGDPIEM